MTQLPNSEQAYVEDAKLSLYVLNPSHKEGWPKGRFLMLQGFDPDDFTALRIAILKHGRENEVVEMQSTPFGVKYNVDGAMTSPNGRAVHIRTVWQIDIGQNAPRFVTLKPLGASR
jgi:hypothetical protein